MERYFNSIFGVAAAVAILYGTGWVVLWGESISTMEVMFDGLPLGQDLLFGGRYIAIFFNSEYYGLALTDRFFDSPLISYFGFGLSASLFYQALSMSEKEDSTAKNNLPKTGEEEPSKPTTEKRIAPVQTPPWVWIWVPVIALGGVLAIILLFFADDAFEPRSDDTYRDSVSSDDPVEIRPEDENNASSSLSDNAQEVGELPTDAKQTLSVAERELMERTYGDVLRAYLDRAKDYPRQARQRRQQGTVTVRFTVDRQGQVSNVRILESSGHRLLDNEVEDLLRRAAPLPGIPEGLPEDRMEIELPMSFSLR